MHWTRILLATTATMAATTKKSNSMHWFRKGLRLKDNPALTHSIDVTSGSGKHYSVYILDGDCYQVRHCSALRANFLVECLLDLNLQLKAKNSRLFCPAGDPIAILPQLWEQFSIGSMTFEEDETLEDYAKARDDAVRTLAKKHGIAVHTVASETLHPLELYAVKAKDKMPATMGTFRTLFEKMGSLESCLEEPASIPSFDAKFAALHPVPTKPTDLPWPRDIPKKDVTPLWRPTDCKDLTPVVRGGETAALQQLSASITAKPTYVALFEKPQTSCTSLKPSTTALSPYMSLGCLSPRMMWNAIQEASDRSTAGKKSQPPVSLHGQLLWRDFNNLMARSANTNVAGSWGQMENNVYCRQIPWHPPNNNVLDQWKTGQTGFPWIDANMRQLAQQGWIHHLGRHAVACFLTRGDLWQSWEQGAMWFESQLLDADYALNGFNWLWLSCSGFFYQYFRCYSPITFQKKNDPSGVYIRKWCPELRKLPDKYIYEPSKAPIAVLRDAGIVLGKDYPRQMVDHAIVSKENMSKMADAYKAYKKDSKASGSANKKKRAAKDGDKAGKKTKQTKLTF